MSNKIQFQQEYNKLIMQGIDEIYVKIILADKFKDILNADEIQSYLAEENNELYNALVEGGFTPFHLSENNISGNIITHGEKESEKAEDYTETEAETECETRNKD
jgi:hypothetical protein